MAAFSPPSSTLKGHKSPVLSLAIEGSILLSGDESSQIRLYDLRTCRTEKCFTSSLFPPDSEGITGLQFNSNSFWASAGSSITEFDLRAEGLIFAAPAPPRPPPAFVLQTIAPFTNSNSEEFSEINSLTTCDASLCAVDDNGMLFVMDDVEGCVTQRIGFDSSPILTSVASTKRIGNKSIVAVGGTDSCLTLFDLDGTQSRVSGKGTLEGDVYNVGQVNFATSLQSASDNNTKSQLCNPPFLNSLCWGGDGRWIVAGLGDGTLGLCSVAEDRKKSGMMNLAEFGEGNGKGKKPANHTRLGGDGTYGHTGSVASVDVPRAWGDGSRYILSGGTDRNVCLWDLKGYSKSVVTGCSSFLIEEGEKVNCVKGGQEGKVFLATTKNEVKIYDLR